VRHQAKDEALHRITVLDVDFFANQHHASDCLNRTKWNGWRDNLAVVVSVLLAVFSNLKGTKSAADSPKKDWPLS
jgi:hypothetical protein